MPKISLKLKKIPLPVEKKNIKKDKIILKVKQIDSKRPIKDIHPIKDAPKIKDVPYPPPGKRYKRVSYWMCDKKKRGCVALKYNQYKSHDEINKMARLIKDRHIERNRLIRESKKTGKKHLKFINDSIDALNGIIPKLAEEKSISADVHKKDPLMNIHTFNE